MKDLITSIAELNAQAGPSYAARFAAELITNRSCYAPGIQAALDAPDILLVDKSNWLQAMGPVFGQRARTHEGDLQELAMERGEKQAVSDAVGTTTAVSSKGKGKRKGFPADTTTISDPSGTPVTAAAAAAAAGAGAAAGAAATAPSSSRPSKRVRTHEGDLQELAMESGKKQADLDAVGTTTAVSSKGKGKRKGFPADTTTISDPSGTSVTAAAAAAGSGSGSGSDSTFFFKTFEARKN